MEIAIGIGLGLVIGSIRSARKKRRQQAAAHAAETADQRKRREADELITVVLPTTWSVAKTEAIDFSQPFLWFDDDCFTGERITLRQHGVFDSWIEVDLSKHQGQMVHELKLLQSYVEDAAG